MINSRLLGIRMENYLGSEGKDKKKTILYNGSQCCKLNVEEVCGKRKAERTAVFTERNRDLSKYNSRS